MSDFLFARSQMALSLAFHILFAAVGIGMPLLMVIAEGLYLRTGNETYLTLAKRWSKGTAILFAVGAVSGTVLSFELGLLWPGFMKYAGSVIGMPFSLEGFAFFTEAIFLGIYLYGWDRVPPLAHWGSGLMVALSGMTSGIFVVTANAWMNTPAGFDIVDGTVTNIDPVAAMMNPAALQQVLHMTLAAYIATGLIVAAVHAYYLLQDRQSGFHRRAFGLALGVVLACVPLQFVSGDYSAKTVADTQPAKFAAMEGHYETQTNAPLVIGGIPDSEDETVHYAVKVPGFLSFLAEWDVGAEVTGLEDIPRDEWPNVPIVHWAFDLMIACGTLMLGLVLWAGGRWWQSGGIPTDPWLLRAAVAAGPLGFIAIEAGWVVTEVGRQPWIIQGVMRTKEAVTPMDGLVVPFTTFTLLYVVLSVLVVFLLRRQFAQTHPDAEPTGAGT